MMGPFIMMEEIPPSYESATTRDAWKIIAHYIPSTDLCAASLVCQRWYEIFEPFLWGAPASHFGTDNDAVYVALTRFRRTLKRARLSVRMLTHTLHLPPALSEIYGGPRPAWLRDLLDYLPCLQSLIVSKLPFFDHRAMMALGDASDDRRNGTVHPYMLRLLLAEKEPNTTSIGLARALLQFPALIYLDLSYTTSAKDRMVLSVISELHELQVLKLRGIGLKDDDAEFLANAIGRRVRFLDLRNNMLTDMAVRSLVQACFRAPEIVISETNGERASTVQPRAASRSMSSEFLQHSDIDDKFVELLTRPLTGRSLLENLPHIGITHLLIAENQLTVEGVAGLLSSRLYMLDAGTVDTAKSLTKGQPSMPPQRYPDSSPDFPGVEKLIPIINSAAKDGLTYLRIHHAVVTKEPPIRDMIPLADKLPELSGQELVSQLDTSEQRVELDANKQILELPAETSRFELADTSISNCSTTLGAHQLSPVNEDEPLTLRRGSVFAPETVETHQAVDDVHTAPYGENEELTDEGRPTASSPRPGDDSTYPEPVLEDYSPHLDTDPRSQKIKELLGKRPRNTTFSSQSKGIVGIPYLHPCHIPHIETLILTDVPSHVPVDSPITSSLIRFIVACSDESLLASLKAKADYSLPPGRARIAAEQQHARALFGLRRLVLEISPTTKRSELRKLSPWRPRSRENAVSRSATGDMDSERLWSAALADFSFFGEEECGIPENDTGKYFSMEILNEKITLVPEDDEGAPFGTLELNSQMSPNFLQPSPLIGPHQHQSRPNSPHLQPTSHPGSQGLSPRSARFPGHNVDQQPPMREPEIDLVSELASFRRSKKREYEGLVKNSREQLVFASPPANFLSPLISPLPSWTYASFQTPSSSSPLQSPLPPLSRVTSRTTVSSIMPLHVEGHWKGEVKIVRNASPKGRSGVVDIYGNYFEKGYLYP